MGFRSTFVSEHRGFEWPQSFRDKWEPMVFFAGDGSLIASRSEGKTYERWQALPEDIQRVIRETDRLNEIPHFRLIYFHECGGVTRVEITKDAITYSEPDSWSKTDGVTHHYCYGCSDPS